MESKEVRHLGCTETKKVDVRLIAATNQNLPVLIKENRFRSDLYYRLNQLEIQLPALWERKEDVSELIRHFLRNLGLNPSHNGNGRQINELGRILSSRDWPGNVRELETEIKKLSMLYNNDLGAMIESLKQDTLSERERLAIALQQTGWNQRETGRQLGLDEATIRYRIKKFQISQ